MQIEVIVSSNRSILNITTHQLTAKRSLRVCWLPMTREAHALQAHVVQLHEAQATADRSTSAESSHGATANLPNGASMMSTLSAGVAGISGGSSAHSAMTVAANYHETIGGGIGLESEAESVRRLLRVRSRCYFKASN